MGRQRNTNEAMDDEQRPELIHGSARCTIRGAPQPARRLIRLTQRNAIRIDATGATADEQIIKPTSQLAAVSPAVGCDGVQ